MARDWERTSLVILDILERMKQFGTNVAPFPFCITQEIRDGKVVWCVDIHVRVRRKTEFDISTEGETVTEALRAAYLGLNSPTGVTERAGRANAAFGIPI